MPPGAALSPKGKSPGDPSQSSPAQTKKLTPSTDSDLHHHTYFDSDTETLLDPDGSPNLKSMMPLEMHPDRSPQMRSTTTSSSDTTRHRTSSSSSPSKRRAAAIAALASINTNQPPPTPSRKRKRPIENEIQVRTGRSRESSASTTISSLSTRSSESMPPPSSISPPFTSPLVSTKHSTSKINRKNQAGETLLHRASAAGKIDQVRDLLERGALLNAQCNAGWTPLHKACLKGYVQIVRMLCEAGAKIDIQSDDEHDTPLHDACSNGHKEVVLVLLYHGANPRIQNSEGLFPHEMVDDNLEELKQILLEATKTFKETKESTDTREDSEPPMSLVTKRRSRRTSTASDVPLQLPANGRPKRGITSGRDDFLARDVNYRDAYRRSHLHLQALQGHGPFVRELLSIGAAHHARDRDGNSPLHLAARGGHDDAVLALLEYGAEVNALSKQGETPLHEVSGRGHKEIVQMLLFYGADPTIKDIDGRTALDVAIESPSTAAEGEVDLLKDKFVELGGVLPEEKEASVKVEEPDEMPHVERHIEETLANGRLTSPLASQSGRGISDVTAVDEGEFQEMQVDSPEPPNPTSPILETNHIPEEPSQPSEPPPEPPWMKLAALDHLADSVEKEVCQLLPLYTMQFHDCTFTDQIYVAHAQICSVLGFTSQELFEKYPQLSKRALSNREKTRFCTPFVSLVSHPLTRLPPPELETLMHDELSHSNVMIDNDIWHTFAEQRRHQFMAMSMYLVPLEQVQQILVADFPVLATLINQSVVRLDTSDLVGDENVVFGDEEADAYIDCWRRVAGKYVSCGL